MSVVLALFKFQLFISICCIYESVDPFLHLND